MPTSALISELGDVIGTLIGQGKGRSRNCMLLKVPISNKASTESKSLMHTLDKSGPRDEPKFSPKASTYDEVKAPEVDACTNGSTRKEITGAGGDLSHHYWKNQNLPSVS